MDHEFGLETMDIKEIYVSFTKDRKTHHLNWITFSFLEIIPSHCLKKLLKKDHSGSIVHFNAIWFMEMFTLYIPLNLQYVLSQYQ